MRDAWDSLSPARRPAIRRGQGQARTHETDAASWRDTASTTGAVQRPRHPGRRRPLSAKITVDGRIVGGFNLSEAAYTVPWPPARRRRSRRCDSRPAAHASRSSRRRRVFPGRRREGHQARLLRAGREELRLQLRADTTLANLRLNGKPLALFKPVVLTYNAVMNVGADVSSVKAERQRSAATVSVEPATTPTGRPGDRDHGSASSV